MFGLSKIVLPPEHEYYYNVENAEEKNAEVLQKLLGETAKKEMESDKNVPNAE